MKTLVTRKVADLAPYEHNPRTHPEAQIAQIAASIREVGFTNPVLIDEKDMILAGYARLLAARTLKLEEIQCLVVPGLTDAQKAAYVIADNKLALNAGWNYEQLAAELAGLASADYDTNLTGFSEVEMAALLEAIDATVPDLDLPPPDADGDDATDPDAAGLPPPTSPTTDWKGMPDFHQPDAGPFRTIKVHFKDQASVDAFAALIDQKLTDRTRWVWYPKVAKVVSTEVYV